MKAMLVIKTGNGYAVAPYTGSVPENFVEQMSVAEQLSHSYRSNTVVGAMETYLEPTEDKEQPKELA